MSKARQTHLKNEQGFTLVELMVALVIIGILAGVAISNFNSAKVRAYDVSAQASLNYLYKACKDYWSYNSSLNACLVSTVSNPEYGYTPPADVDITIDAGANNTEYDFVATARHTSSSHAYVVDHLGIVSQTFDVAVDEGDGNNGGGCSTQAKKDPKKLGKGSKGCKP